MKYKKYLLILIITIFLGCNKTYALYAENDYCYYKSDTFQGYVKITEKNGSADIDKMTVLRIGKTAVSTKRKISNEKNGVTIGKSAFVSAEYKADIPKVNIVVDSEGVQCPAYALGVYNTTGFLGLKFNGKVYVALTDSSEVVSTSTSIWSSSNANNGYAPNVSSEDYVTSLCTGDDCITGTEEENTNCKTIFGTNTNNSESLASLINSVLQYVRIIVPILIILLGSLDFAKAVIASKEDEMKKAQIAFIKRLIAGVVVFLIPIFVNIIMRLADIVWEGKYDSCTIEEIKELE